MNKKLAEVEKIALENIYYDEVSGALLNIDTGHMYKQSNCNAYPQVQFKKEGKHYTISAHRVIWFLHYGGWPKGFIDHINGDRHDNSIENLRDINPKDNCKNKICNRNGKILYVKEINKNKFIVSTPRNYMFEGNRSEFRYKCSYQAEMAALMIENKEFKPEVHNERVVNHLNNTGVLLLKNLVYINKKDLYNVSKTFKGKRISKSFKKYDDAILFLNKIVF